MVYIVRADAAVVERVDLRTGRVVASIPVGSNPSRLVFNYSGQRAYVTNQFSDSISVIDAVTNRRIDEIVVPGGPAAVVVSPDEQALYVTTNADLLYAIQPATKRVLRTIRLPAASHHLLLHPSRRLLYVATRAAGTVIEIETERCRVRRTFEVGGQTQALAVAADSTELYVANEWGRLNVVDLECGEVSAALQLDGRAFGLALSPDNAKIYIGLVSEGRVQVVDRRTLRSAGMINTGGVPREIAFDRSEGATLIANEAGWVDVVR